ncbi:hypothetical protein BFJ68_g6807 [Fusarium oxysporum]|uniref:Uncharacterized protein n=2 Tax=Fusarium oxysporum TaxID=5507 RepID=A0A420RAE2_FUSOX|nr:hypothetical protein FOZG_01863 [Fusarium oxysporum Fo47]RKL13990.1 hypothetical protein BFJ68_g6807 [Fusarium oxysporum]
MIIPLDENKAYLEVLHATGLEIDEIPVFMTPYPGSPRWERRVLLMKDSAREQISHSQMLCQMMLAVPDCKIRKN